MIGCIPFKLLAQDFKLRIKTVRRRHDIAFQRRQTTRLRQRLRRGEWRDFTRHHIPYKVIAK